MYSLLPALVAMLFLLYGFYVVHAKGLNRVTRAFLIVCVTTFCWQFAWAALFQIHDEILAIGIIKLGWLLILFLPTSLYQFLIELTGRYQDRKLAYASYVICTVFAIILITTDYVIEGVHTYSFGFYPKAGLLHPLHVLQTALVVSRGLYITYKKLLITQANEKTKYQYCIASLFIYFFAAIDYACNYGIEFYPPGVIFIAISLGIIALATTRYQVMDNSRMIASSIAHEMRTPLATLTVQSSILFEHLPELVEHYQKTKPEHERTIPETILPKLISLAASMRRETRTVNEGIDHLLAITSYEFLDKRDFYSFPVQQCVEESITRIGDDELSLADNLYVHQDFMVFASKEYLVFVIINLLKNARESIRKHGKGEITIHIYSDQKGNRIEVTDTGAGIDDNVMPHIFDKFFTTKPRGQNLGIGLSFCQAVMKAFGGEIYCESKKNERTTFSLLFRH